MKTSNINEINRVVAIPSRMVGNEMTHLCICNGCKWNWKKVVNPLLFQAFVIVYEIIVFPVLELYLK